MGTTSEKLTYLNTTKTLIKDNLNLGGANISNEPFRVYSSKLIDIYKDFLANGTDTLWNNWLPKVTGSGETITLNNTIEAKMDFVYKGNTSQTGTPTPDSPQDIQVVSGDNTIKVEGKNLCNGITQNYFVNQAATRCGYTVGDSGLIIEVDGVSDYTISSNTAQTRYRVGCLNEIPAEGGSTTIVYNSSNKDGTSDSVTINTNGYKYLVVNATDLTAIQIEKNSTKTLFEEYKSQTYPISLGNIELCKIGDYQDRIYKDNGKWYLNKQIGKVVLDGSESWSLNESGTGYSRYTLTNNTATTNYSNTIVAMSDKFIGSKDTDVINADADANRICIVSNHRFIIKTIDNNLLTLQAFKSWLSTHNTIVYYVLKTPTYTEITDTTLLSQLEAIKKSYNNQTNISQENNDLPFELDVVALGELEI